MDLAAALSRLVNLRKLSVNDHGFNNTDIRSLLPILGELRALYLEGRFGDRPGPANITDNTLSELSETSDS